MRYTRAYKRVLRKRSRTIPVRGTGDDEGKWYKCWNCGFYCKVDREALGGANSSSGNTHTTYAHESPHTGVKENDDLALKPVMRGPDKIAVVLELGSDGKPKPIRHDFKSDISTGCPFCGCRNWRGDY